LPGTAFIRPSIPYIAIPFALMAAVGRIVAAAVTVSKVRRSIAMPAA
jgi:hypothetical protein